MTASCLGLLLSVVTVLPQGDELEQKVQAALERARPVLIKHLGQQRKGVRALLCLAALHDGVPTDNKALVHAIRRLSKVRFIGTYEAAIRLMVMAEHPAFPRRDAVCRIDVKTLLKNRVAGGFTYPGRSRNSWWDLSNTQYAALGLRAAAAMGHEIDKKIWLDMLKATLKAQHEDGGFGYSLKNRRKNPYSSMTVAGIAVLQICKQHLPKDDVKEFELDKRLAHAWDWMLVNAHDIGSDHALSTLYFHYGLERAAILSDKKKIGDVDWYRRGAEMLVEMQGRHDGWSSSWEFRPGALKGPGSPVDTAFAVLFLRRKFKKVLPKTYLTVLTLGVQATDPEIQKTAERAVKRGLAAVPDVLKAMRSDVLPRRKAAALAIHGISGKDFGYDPVKAAEDSAPAIKAAEVWWLRNPNRKR
ncbi:MAG: prenyltransferase/squalene oxidase repeat-containing protein [Planctomycetota bacterium]|jgi:hypothetical protein